MKKLKLTAVFRSWQTAAIACFLLFTVNSFSDTHYVSLTGGNVSPFTSWADAATNIQAAVDVASSGDIVLVTNGVYQYGGDITPGYSCSNRVVITNDITVESVTGPGNTIILGKGPNGNLAVRGAYLSSGILSGFTISNGHTRTSGNYYYDNTGGGVNMNGGNGIITNCLITGNSGGWDGGGTAYGTVNNCTISGNSADGEGGGTFWSTINNCTISGNTARHEGGGTSWGTINNCTISENKAGYYGGGTYASTVNNCTISGNLANRSGGGSFGDTANNCTISGNSADNTGGGKHSGTANNCTISGNTADYYGGGTDSVTVNNCIVWDNTASSGANFYDCTIRYSCSSPLPSGVGNISSDPQSVNAANDDYHLWFTSPCINAGSNGYVQGTTDLDGNPRILSGTVDMGCYEVSRNYLFSAPAIVAPVNVLSGGTKSFFTIDSQVVITGSKVTGHFVALETDQGGIETNGISQTLNDNSWQQIVNLNSAPKTMSYFTCDSNICEVSLSKTTLEITKILLEIATNALIFPEENSIIFADKLTNIIWDVEKITDDIDGTNLIITKISVHLAETTNEVAIVTNNINNLLGKIPWLVPADLIGGDTNYVLKFEVVNSLSLTNSRIFSDNVFVIVPEIGMVFSIFYSVCGIFICCRKFLFRR